MKNFKFLLIFLLSLLLVTPSFAADSTITGLTDLAATPATDDELVVWDTSTTSTKKVTYANVATMPDADSYGGLTSAVSSIGATETTLLIDTAQTVSDDLTIPATMSLFITRGGSISVANTKTLTINGTVIAGSYQIFTGTGTATFSGGGISLGTWWSGGDEDIATPLATTTLTGAIEIATNAEATTGSSSDKALVPSNIAYFATMPKGKNLIVNAGMEHAQRGASGSASFTGATTPANNDDTYLLDRYVLLSDGNDICDVTQQTGGGVSGNEAYVRLDVETVSKKFGLLQIIENKKCKSIVGGTASLSFEAKVTNATKLSDIRAVVLAWDGAADTVTSDVVSAWNAEGAVITPAANWTAENTAANLSVTTSWTLYEIENISIDTASTTNVAVFIYQNNVATNDTAGVFLELTNIQIEEGAVATDFEYKDPAVSLIECQRRYYKSYDQAVAPGTADTDGSFYFVASSCANADYTIRYPVRFPVTMAGVATVVAYDAVGASSKVTMAAGNGIAATISKQGDGGCMVEGTNGAASTSREILFHVTAEIEL